MCRRKKIREGKKGWKYERKGKKGGKIGEREMEESMKKEVNE